MASFAETTPFHTGTDSSGSIGKKESAGSVAHKSMNTNKLRMQSVSRKSMNANNKSGRSGVAGRASTVVSEKVGTAGRINAIYDYKSEAKEYARDSDTESEIDSEEEERRARELCLQSIASPFRMPGTLIWGIFLLAIVILIVWLFLCCSVSGATKGSKAYQKEINYGIEQRKEEIAQMQSCEDGVCDSCQYENSYKTPQEQVTPSGKTEPDDVGKGDAQPAAKTPSGKTKSDRTPGAKMQPDRKAGAKAEFDSKAGAKTPLESDTKTGDSAKTLFNDGADHKTGANTPPKDDAASKPGAQAASASDDGHHYHHGRTPQEATHGKTLSKPEHERTPETTNLLAFRANSSNLRGFQATSQAFVGRRGGEGGMEKRQLASRSRDS